MSVLVLLGIPSAHATLPANRKLNETACGKITSYLMVRCGYNESTYDYT